MSALNHEQVSLKRFFEAVSEELHVQAKAARNVDELIAEAAPNLTNAPGLQEVDRLWQSLEALSCLAANAAA